MYVRMYVLVRMYGCVRLCLWLRTLELAFPATLTFVRQIKQLLTTVNCSYNVPDNHFSLLN